MIWGSKTSKFERLLQKYAPDLIEEFRQGVADLARRVDLKRLEAALDAGDVASAINAMHLDETAFVQFEEAFRRAFIGAGISLAADIPKGKDPNGNDIVLRFNGRDSAAEDWLRSHSGSFIRDVVADTRQTLRDTMTDGLAKGKNPNKLVPELVGRINPMTRRREGGVIGLTAEQGEFVRNAATELSSGDPAKLNDYLSRKLRDKNYDKPIAAALRDGKPVPVAVAEKALASYRNRLLAFRARTIGRTETFSAMSKSEFTAFQQAIASGKVAEKAVTKTWDDADDNRVRHTHVILGDGKPIPFLQPFVAASGARLMHPHDRSLGAPASEIIGCRCRCQYKIDFLAGVT